jgi:integrase/recombinase XerD
LGIRELLEVLLDDKAKRRLSIRNKSNSVLFPTYYAAIHLKLAPCTYQAYFLVLEKFRAYLGEFPASEQLAIAFLNTYKVSPASMVRYTNILRGYLRWLGEDLTFRPRRPKTIPQYVESADVRKLIDCIAAKKTHKKSAARDILLVQFACLTGLRRSELSSLKVRDILLDQRVVVVRGGKGLKDRTVPLPDGLIPMLEEYLRNRLPSERVFPIGPRTISDKIHDFSRQAGVELHAHSLRHNYAESLVEAGVPITSVQALLGHENLETTAKYLGLKPGALQKAVDDLGKASGLILGKTEQSEGIHLRLTRDSLVAEGGSFDLSPVIRSIAQKIDLKCDPDALKGLTDPKPGPQASSSDSSVDQHKVFDARDTNGTKD